MGHLKGAAGPAEPLIDFQQFLLWMKSPCDGWAGLGIGGGFDEINAHVMGLAQIIDQRVQGSGGPANNAYFPPDAVGLIL